MATAGTAALLACVSDAVVGEATLPCAYEATMIVGPVGPHGIQTHVVILGLNDANVGAGYYYWTATALTACTWTASEGVQAIPGVPPGVSSAQAVAVNNNGWILVNANVTPGGKRGFVAVPSADTFEWHMIIPTSQGTYGAGWSFCYGINDNNEVVGVQSTGSSSDPVHPYGGFRWSIDGGMVSIQPSGWMSCECKGISDDGVIVGNVSQSVVADPGIGGVRGFVLGRTGGTTIIEPPAPYVRTWCTDINNTGLVVGGATPTTGAGCAFRYDVGTSTMNCAAPPSGYSSWNIWEINDSGVACGSMKPVGDGLSHPGVSNGVTVMDVAALIITELEVPVWDGNAINSLGVIASSCYPECAYLLSPAVVLADLTCDARVDADDLALMLNAWGSSTADLDGDRVTAGADLGILLGAWSP